MNKGLISWNFTGLAKNPANGHWYYVNKGEINWKYTGLAKNTANGNWYYVTNGEIDIDKIIAQKKRRTLISFEAKKIKDIGGYTLETPDGNQETTVYASDNIESHEYYLDFEHDDYGLVRLIFSPNEKLLTAIKPFAPLTVRNKIPDYFTEGEDE